MRRFPTRLEDDGFLVCLEDAFFGTCVEGNTSTTDGCISPIRAGSDENLNAALGHVLGRLALPAMQVLFRLRAVPSVGGR